MQCPTCRTWLIDGQSALAAVLASPAMGMKAAELDAWLKHYNLGVSVSFEGGLHTAELRRPVGDGSSVTITTAEEKDFNAAVISACQIFEEVHVCTT